MRLIPIIMAACIATPALAQTVPGLAPPTQEDMKARQTAGLSGDPVNWHGQTASNYCWDRIERVGHGSNFIDPGCDEHVAWSPGGGDDPVGTDVSPD